MIAGGDDAPHGRRYQEQRHGVDVASAPRNCVGPSTANSAAAKNAAR